MSEAGVLTSTAIQAELDNRVSTEPISQCCPLVDYENCGLTHYSPTMCCYCHSATQFIRAFPYQESIAQEEMTGDIRKRLEWAFTNLFNSEHLSDLLKEVLEKIEAALRKRGKQTIALQEMGTGDLIFLEGVVRLREAFDKNDDRLPDTLNEIAQSVRTDIMNTLDDEL